MPSDQTFDSFWDGVVDIVLSSMLLLTLVAFLWAEGILMLNVIISFRRKKRSNVYNPLLAISIGLGVGMVPFVALNWKELVAGALTLDMLGNGILSSVVLSFPITAVICIIVYIVKENLYMRGKNDNG